MTTNSPDLVQQLKTENAKLKSYLREVSERHKKQKNAIIIDLEKVTEERDRLLKQKEVKENHGDEVVLLRSLLREEKERSCTLLSQNKELEEKITVIGSEEGGGGGGGGGGSLEISNLKKQLSRCRDELQVSQEDRGVILSAMAEKDLQIDQMREKMSKISRSTSVETQQLEEALTAEKKKNENLKKTLKKIRTSLQKGDSQDILQQVAEAHKKITHLQVALRETTLKNGELEKELQTTRDERDKAQARYESEIQSISSLSKESVDKLENEFREMQLKNEKQAKKLGDAKEAHKRVSQNLQEENLKQMETQKMCFEVEMKTLKEEFQEKELDYQKELKLLRPLQQENEEIKNLIRKGDEEVTEMKVKVEEHERRVEEVENQMEQKSEDWAKEKESIETEAKLNHLKLEEEFERYREEKTEEMDVLSQSFTDHREASKVKEDQLQEEVSKLEVQIKDHKIQIKLNEKKNRNLIKELQAQVQKEKVQREKTEMMKARTSASVGNVAGSGLERERKRIMSERRSVEIEERPKPKLTQEPQQKEASSQQRPKEGAPQENTIQAKKERAREKIIKLQKEVLHLSKVLGELREKQIRTEETNRFLKENIVVLTGEIDKKDKIVQEYLMNMKISRISEPGEYTKSTTSDSLLGQFGQAVSYLSGEVSISQEAYKKQMLAMEETILQNIQLRKDIGFLGNEVERYEEENKLLKMKIRESDQPNSSAERSENHKPITPRDKKEDPTHKENPPQSPPLPSSSGPLSSTSSSSSSSSFSSMGVSSDVPLLTTGGFSQTMAAYDENYDFEI